MTSDAFTKNLARPQFENISGYLLDKTGTWVSELPKGEIQKKKTSGAPRNE